MFQLLGGEGVRYDATRFNWLGVMASSNGMVLAWAASGIKTLDDARRQTVATGATGANDDVWVYTKMLNATTGTKFNLITGYQGTSAVNVAIERGEVVAMGRSSYYGFRAQKPDWLRDGKVNILAQIGFAKQPELPDVPLLLDLMSSEEERQMALLVTLPTAIGYNHWVAPEVPADRVTMLREAYEATLKDPALLADAQKQNLEIVPKTPTQVEALIRKAAETPPEIRQKVAKILEWK
jgi:tripartite-type tricarboxylate transporter receptor subunit TctC